MARRHMFERVRTFWAEETGVWCALDFESWEREHTVLTEFGWSLIRWEGKKEIAEQGHLIVKENRAYSNGQYVPDYRDVSLSVQRKSNPFNTASNSELPLRDQRRA
jgi:hypothetical protein